MSDNSNDNKIDIQEIVEALLNICGQAAEMQIDEDSRLAIYDMCDIVAEHHGVQRFDALIEQEEDGSSKVTYYGEGVGPSNEPKLRLVSNNGESLDQRMEIRDADSPNLDEEDSDTIH
jgi:hypothetical protein